MFLKDISYFYVQKYKMGVFDKFIQEKKGSSNSKVKLGRTTEGFFIGVAEAEGEANNTAITLSEVFEDFLDAVKQINNEKFIITGRKGSGKSAIGEYIYSLANSDANIFSKFIKKSDVDIEQIVQIGNEQGMPIEQELLFKWVILTQILNLIAENQNLSKIKEMSDLKKFIDRNRGFIDIKKNEVKEIIRERGTNINLEYFKRFYTASFNKKIAIKEEKTDFFKLLPYLEETVIKILKQDTDNSYVLIFDDLDIGFYNKSERGLLVLSDLLRVAKYYNNEIFGREGLDSKIIILLRNDIVKHLRFNADTAKIFASYAIELNWYEEAYRSQEDNLKLKQFINKRIVRNFEKQKIDYLKEKPWESFVDETDFVPWNNGNNKSSFKYIIDHTFFRPRDLILFFKDIDKYKFPIPINRNNINILIGNYANQMILEIQNELTAVFTSKDIISIFDVLRLYEDKKPFSYSTILADLRNSGFQENAESVAEELFYYSLIGNINDSSDVCFKFREKGCEICKININEKFILHYILKVYFKNN